MSTFDPITYDEVSQLKQLFDGNGKALASVNADAATQAGTSTKWAGANKTVSTSPPSGGADGDIWFEREA